MQIIDPAPKPLALENDGSLDILFLGTGSAFAATHYQTNFLAVKGSTHVLIDCGMTGPAAMRDLAGLEPTDIEMILPSHSHADHVGGIECLALMNRYVGQRFMNKPKLKMVVTTEYSEVLWDRTLRGGLEWNELGPDGMGLRFTDFFDFLHPQREEGHRRETFVIDLPCGGDENLHIELFRTKHIAEQSESWQTSFISYGVFVDERVFFSGDTRFDPELIEDYAPRAEVMFHDVQFFAGAVHAPLPDLKTLPADVRERMYLVHYADNWEAQDISDFAGWVKQGVLYRF